MEFYEKLICSDAPQRRKLAVYINPPELDDEVKNAVKEKLINDVQEFKSSMPLYALPKPFIDA
jgi:hypothetical protein